MPETMVVRAGTRASRLALWQTEHVIARLAQAWPNLSFDRVRIRTLGDRVTNVPLPKIGDRGLFSREDPSDVLISGNGRRLADLQPGARLGTSSLRRRAQVMAIRPDLDIVDIRGNVPTRIEKVQRGEYDATLLALAGLRRLELTGTVTEVFASDAMVPAPGQGALAVQVRAGDDRIQRIVATIDDIATRFATAAERRVLNALQGGCQAPIGALATWTAPGVLHLVAIVAGVDGRRVLRVAEARPVTDEGEALALGGAVAADLASQGADALIREARQLTGAGDPT